MPEPPLSSSFLLRLPSHDVLRNLLTTYCNPLARARLSLTCKTLRAALVASTPVLTLRWPAVVVALEPKVKAPLSQGDSDDEQEEEEEEEKEEGRGKEEKEESEEGEEEEEWEWEEEEDDEEDSEEEEEEEEHEYIGPNPEEEADDEATEWSELPADTLLPTQLYLNDDWQHLQKLEIYNAGLLLPSITKTLLARPLPNLTHLLLHSKHMPLPSHSSLKMIRDMVRTRTAYRNARLAMEEVAVLAFAAKWDRGEGRHMLPYYNNDEERVQKMGEEQASMHANLRAAMTLFPQATMPRVSAAILPVFFPEAVRKAKEEEEARGDVGVREEAGREVGGLGGGVICHGWSAWD